MWLKKYRKQIIILGFGIFIVSMLVGAMVAHSHKKEQQSIENMGN